MITSQVQPLSEGCYARHLSVVCPVVMVISIPCLHTPAFVLLSFRNWLLIQVITLPLAMLDMLKSRNSMKVGNKN